MPGEDAADIFMNFQLPTGLYVTGESTTDLSDSTSSLKADSTTQKMATGFRKGNIFEVDSFTFQAGIGGEDEQTAEKNFYKELQRAIARLEQRNTDDSKSAQPKLKSSSVGQFKRFRKGKDVKYPVDMQPVTITRGLDRASLSLMQYCIRRTVFKNATLIKRKAAGTASAGEIFLRIDFANALITKVGWDEDEPIKEKTSFICRAITINYRPQLPDGTLGAIVPGFWKLPTSTSQPVTV